MNFAHASVITDDPPYSYAFLVFLNDEDSERKEEWLWTGANAEVRKETALIQKRQEKDAYTNTVMQASMSQKVSNYESVWHSKAHPLLKWMDALSHSLPSNQLYSVMMVSNSESKINCQGEERTVSQKLINFQAEVWGRVWICVISQVRGWGCGEVCHTKTQRVHSVAEQSIHPSIHLSYTNWPDLTWHTGLSEQNSTVQDRTGQWQAVSGTDSCTAERDKCNAAQNRVTNTLVSWEECEGTPTKSSFSL